MAKYGLKHTDEQFLQLMRIALGNADSLDAPLSLEEWEEVMMMSAKQSVVGVAFSGVERLPREQMPPLEVVMDWSAVVDKIERENVRLNETAVKVCSIFKQEGINACILKGQGMGALYDKPLRRCSGDIDVWMEGGKDRVVSYIMKNFPKAKDPGEGGHHIAVKLRGEIDMEVHYLPGELYSPMNCKRLNAWFNAMEKEQWGRTVGVKVSGGAEMPINVPSAEFNQVFILSHLFHHWAFEGCGMKQLVDYYYVLLRSAPQEASLKALASIGLKPLLGAVMYVMQQFGLPKSKMLTEPNERLGMLLLEDIVQVGTVSAEALLNGEYGKENKFHKFYRRFARMVKMMPLAPTEIVWVLPENLIGWMQGKTRE